MRCAAIAVTVLAVAGQTGVARADSFAELVGGVMAPMGDDDYDDAVDISGRLGVRVGALTVTDEPAVGFEIAADWTPLASGIDSPISDESFHRVRALGGVRLGVPVGSKALLVGRLAAGVSYIRANISGEILGVQFDRTETDIGLAVDPSIGIQALMGETAVGVSLGFPVAIHDHEPEEPEGFSIDFTSVDMDVLFVLTRRM